MTRKALWVGSASVLALLAHGLSAQAQDTVQGPIETVVVTGIRASAQRAIQIQRNATAIVNAVSAEDIGKFPDKNVADALQRVPGVQTFSQASGEGGFGENDRVALRGTNPSLTQTLVDGHSVATGDWFILDQYQTVGRSVSYDLFPSEIVDTVKVYKSQEADLVEGGVAGSVDIITRKPLDFEKDLTLQGSAQAYYNDLADRSAPQLNGLVAWHNSSRNFGILLQGFYEERNLRRDGQEFLGYSTTTVNNQSVLYPTLIGSALFEQKRKREGGDIAIEWRPNHAFDLSVTGFYSHMGADNINNNYMAWITNEIGAGNQIINPVIQNGTLVSASFPLINPATGNAVAGAVEDSIYRPGAAAESWYVNGEAHWRPTAHWNIDGQLGYTRGLGLTPLQPTWESEAMTGVSYNLSSGGAAVSFPDISTTDPAAFQNDWAWSDQFTTVDKEFYTKADFEYDFGGGPLDTIKFGARYADHTRNVIGYDRGTCFYCGSPSTMVAKNGTYPSGFASGFAVPGMPTQLWLPDVNLITQLVMPKVTPYTSNFFYWPGSFNVAEKDWAGYAMANFSGRRWRANAGLRIVDTEEDVGSYISNATGTANAYGNYALDQVNHNYLDPLPSANFVYDLRSDMQARFAVARVMSRPDYSALGGAVSLTDTIHTGTGGNPSLKPIRAWTYDAAWDWYFGKASLLSVDAFYMDLTTDVDFGVHNATYLDATASGQAGHPVYATYAITSPTNSSGSDKGVEIAWQQPIWNGFGVITNYTFADGEASGGGPLVGDAKHSYNLTGYYENAWLSARLAYTWRSKVLIGLDRSTAENEAATGSLDASVSFNVTENAAITLDAVNLTDEKLKYYANVPIQPRAIYDNGRQFFIGFRVKN